MTAIDRTLTAPWSPDTHELLTRTLSHVVSARVVTGGELARNLVRNPNFELDSAGWTATTGAYTRDTAAPITGTASGKAVGAGATAIGFAYLPTLAADQPPVVQGTPIDVSVVAKVSLAATQLRLDVSYLDDAGAAVGAVVTGTGSALATPGANTPVTLSMTVTPPAGATRVRLLPRTVLSVAAGTALWVDSAFVGAGTYFDGNTPNTTTLVYVWEGTPNASPSLAMDATRPATTVVLDVKGGTVTFDETRSPRVDARGLVCAVPTDQALLDRIDPRTGARLLIDAGYSRPDGLVDVNPLVNLGLRDRPVTRPDDTMSVSGASDEALVIDNAPSSGGTLAGANTVAAMQTLVRMIFPSVTLANPGALTGAAVSQTPIGDKHDALMDLADRIDAKVFDDGLRNWGVYATPVLGAPALLLATGAAGTLTASETTLSRDGSGPDGWYNRVFLTYDWTDASDVQHKVTAVRSITSGPYAATTGNVRTLELTREVPATQTEATAAAAALVKRTVTRGRSFTVTAIAAYWLRPGMTVAVQLPLGDPEEHLVASVAFDLSNGTMRVTTRLPDGTYTIGA